MFLIQDNREQRSKTIRSLIEKDLSLAALAAVADFEWTYHRCILALGKSPTRTIRENILPTASFKDYTRIWNEEVYPRVKRRLKEFCFGDSQFFSLRNRIVHGELHELGFMKFEYGKKDVEEILLASERLTEFAAEYNDPLYDKRIIRYSSR